MNHVAWMGSDDAWRTVLEARASADEMIKSGRAAGEDKRGMPLLWERHGDTALVHISGSLVNGHAGFMRYFGVTGYDDIASAALQAAADPETTKMLFLVDSGGGQVSGLADFGQFLSQVSRVKPSAVYTSTKIGSAAYWASSAIKGPILMGPTAEVGSIGTAMMHKDFTKQMEANGVKMTILRSGKLKMAGSPFEALGEDLQAHLQDQINDLTDLFVAQVKSARPGMTQANIDKVLDGRMFLGKKAVAVGLSDRIASFDQALKLLDKNVSQKHTSSNSKGATMNYNLTDEQVARLQAGASLADLGIAETEDDKQAAADAAAAAAKKEAEDAAAKKLAAEKVEADKLAAAAAAANPDGNAVVAHLQATLDTKTTELAKAQADLATTKAAMTAMQANHDSLLKIAREATGRMLVPLGGSADTVAAMDATNIVAKYAETVTTFQARFPIGGAAKPAKVDDKQAASAVPANFRMLKERIATTK